jgi:hypothetical protein
VKDLPKVIQIQGAETSYTGCVPYNDASSITINRKKCKFLNQENLKPVFVLSMVSRVITSLIQDKSQVSGSPQGRLQQGGGGMAMPHISIFSKR